MKKFVALLFIAGLVAGRAQDVENPELDFVQYALSEERSVFEGFWGGEGTDLLPGGTLARMTYDVTGDGEPDRLLAHEMPFRQGRGMQLSWVVYVKTAAGYRGLKERLEDRLEFNESMGFYIDRNRIPPIITTSKDHPNRGLTFSAVMFDGKSFRKVREVLIPHEIPRPDPFLDPVSFYRTEMQKRGFDPGPKVFPSMEVITLGEYLHNPNAPWHNYGDTEALEAHLKQIAPALQSFSIEDADRLIEALKPSPETPSPSEPASGSPSGTFKPPLGAENQSANQKQPPTDTSNATSFAVLAVLALASAVGVLFWWGRRKGT